MTDFVWSCPDCENLLGLLTDEEMIELMESFDDLDVDCGKVLRMHIVKMRMIKSVLTNDFVR